MVWKRGQKSGTYSEQMPCNWEEVKEVVMLTGENWTRDRTSPEDQDGGGGSVS